MNGRSRIVSSFIWRFFEKCGAQIVSFLVTVVLARLLTPEEYGTIALVNVFINFFNVFVDSGLGSAIIQKKEADDIDYSTIFYFNIGVCLVIYALIFCLAPYATFLCGEPTFVILMRVVGVTVIVSALKNVQQAYIMKNFLFKKFFNATILGTILSAFVGVILAYSGFGVWALVFQYLTNTIVDTIILWITVPWRPQKVFSMKRLRELLSYGHNLLLSSIINTFYNEMRQLFIGKIYSLSDLAFYNKGKQFPYLVVTNINTSVDSILFPEMSERQDDIKQISNLQKKSIIICCYIMCPLLIGLAAIADNFICILLTDKWMKCVEYLRIFCLTFIFYPVQTANLNGIKAVGRSDMFFKLEIIQSVIGIIFLVLALQYGPYGIAVMFMLATVVNTAIICNVNGKILEYGFLKQIKDILPSIIMSLFMGVIVFFINYFNMNIFAKLGVQIVTGIALYAAGSFFLQFEGYQYVISIYKSMKNIK